MNKMWASITALFALSIGASAVPTGQSSAPTVTVKNGTYAGFHSPQYNQDFFLGLAYAQPPVGDLRLRQAVSLNSTWTGVKDASAYSAECVGYGTDQWGYNISEDCLYLNVIRPSGFENTKLPVALWIHGGGFTEGGSPDKRYNLSFIVQNGVKIEKPIIGVSINYRLSAWGFLDSQEIVGEGLTNIGLRDQRLALHWVQENIAAFGGDPSKVTIWGESAGGASVGFHLTAYGGRDDGLFRAAIMESGNPIYYGAQTGTAAAQPVFDSIVSQAGCNNTLDKLQCLREVPFDKINNIFNTTTGGIGPTIDGDIVRIYGSVQLERGEFVKVPIIVGANSDEGSAFSPSGINTTAQFKATLANLPTSLQDAILEAYPDDLSVNVIASLGDSRPPGFLGAQFRRSASYYGDEVFIAPRRQTCATWAASGLDAFCYRFNAIPAGVPDYIGATHFQEVAFVFDNTLGEGYGIFPEISTKPFLGKPQSYFDLAFLMSGSWASFVHDLDPNNWKGRQANVTAWPKYDVANPMDMVFDANVTSHSESDTFRKEGMDLINANAAGVYQR